MISIDKIYDAHKVLKNVVRETDLILAPNITNDANIYLKAENLQTTGSFKLRGSYYKISNLTEDEKKLGIIACSAGNHAQGVALAAQKFGIKATIFIPSIAPISKIEATKRYGADIVLVDGVYDDAFNKAKEFQQESGAIFIHPFDDDDIIAGQATIALEILDQIEAIDGIVVPIGGGGLISGIAYTIKTLNPNCKVYGVQAEGACSMYNSKKCHEITGLDCVCTFADGTAVKIPGTKTFEYCEKYVDEIVTVSEDEIAAGVLNLIENQRLVAEGAGALSIAAVMFDKIPTLNRNIVCLVSGGNIDINILSKVIKRGLLKTGRLSDLTIELLDKPGQLRDVSTIVADMGANVIKVRYDQGGKGTEINECNLILTIETRNAEHLAKLEKTFIEKGYKLKSN